MKKIAALIALFLLTLAAPAWAADCILLQASALKPYEEARLGFEKAWLSQRPTGGPKSIAGNTVTQVLLSEQSPTEVNLLKKQLQSARLVVAIGDPALEFVKELKEVPVLYLLAPSAKKMPRNFVGIEMQIAPARQLTAIRKALPEVRTIGALYSPGQHGMGLQEAALSPAASGLSLLIKKSDTPAAMPGALQELAGKINAYWLIPDPQIASPQVFERLLEFSRRFKVPIICFSEKYLARGAALAITFDTADMGAQAAELGALILREGSTASIPELVGPRQVRVVANGKIMERLGTHYLPTAVDAIYSPENGK